MFMSEGIYGKVSLTGNPCQDRLLYSRLQRLTLKILPTTFTFLSRPYTEEEKQEEIAILLYFPDLTSEGRTLVRT